MSPAIALPHPARRLPALVAAFVLVLTLLAFDSALADPAHATTSPAATLVAKINASRAAHGLRPYAVRSDLNAVARAQALRMAARNSLFHNPNLTRDVHNWRWVGENVGYAPDALTVNAAFMASAGHRANILDRDFTEVGVGTVYSGGRLWVAEVFRQPLRASATARVAHTHPVLALGSRGAAVRRVQRKLHVRVTGYYGTRTRRAVAVFQRRHHIAATGRVNAATWRALGI